MRSLTPYLLSLTAAFATYTHAKDSNAVSLTQETFYDFISEHDLVLANFYAPWCRYSKALAPKFEKAATQLKKENIPLVKVDCTREEKLCSDFEIDAFPTLKVFRGPESHEPYDGGRRTDSIISYMRIISYITDEAISTGARADL
ncbi:protein disulfide-isomerase precursor [Aspergillus puulaauensis]|uniref:Protein disulfide-isomerase n=1 Tax=Aspergillus puulaauensis TaxID=1220207 RepID=A0A7R7XLN2_9EURO|nr:protein disulfide-isomerase precursor [Aspergillus puulaauensis]BCS23477.1 protein disulfide-isomerase precursor [Aspergillus puulaauensis]